MEDEKLNGKSEITSAPEPALEPVQVPQETAPQTAPLESATLKQPALEPATPKKRGRPRKVPDDKPKNPVGRPRKTPIAPIAEEEPDPHVMLVSALQRRRAALTEHKRQTFASFMPIRR